LLAQWPLLGLQHVWELLRKRCSRWVGRRTCNFNLIPVPPHQAAEIGIEHNLGLTCDPIDGLVQVPCIVSHVSTPWSPHCLYGSPRACLSLQERNSLGAVKAVTAAQLAMASDNVYRVSLDQAIEAMRLTAADMSVKYKETSLSVRPHTP